MERENSNHNFNQSKLKQIELLSDIAMEFVKFRSVENLTQKELAKKMGISQVMVSKIEKGNYNFTVSSLFEYAEKIGLNLKISFNSPTHNENNLINLFKTDNECKETE